MKKAGLTIPTDKNFIDGTKRYIQRWGADAVRDCDGTELPENVKDFGLKVYKTYFLTRNDNEYAYSHDDALMNVAVTTKRHTAFFDTLEINLLDGLYKEQLEVNTYDYKKYWQVFDRTTGEEKTDWEYLGNDILLIRNVIPMHEYTINFFCKQLWNPVQVYNYNCNHWTVEKDRDFDPIYPETLQHIKNNLREWLKDNNQIDVVRFTTFFYHFFLLYITGTKQKLFDWFNYAMTASPAMFEMFEKKYGYRITLEDILTEGYYGNHFLMPTPAYLDYMDLVERFVCDTMRDIIEIVHDSGKEVAMFWGDNWIGAEPYGKYFKDIDLDIMIGSVQSGASVRSLTDIPRGVKCKEIRLNPYFFPDTLATDDGATFTLNYFWSIERRALLRKTVDRIGFGGYLSLADKRPLLCQTIDRICDEFRTIYQNVKDTAPYCAAKVAILNFWGSKRAWLLHGVCQDQHYPANHPYMGVAEALSGLPVDVHFIDFDDVKNGMLEKEYFDVVFNYGHGGTSFVGDYLWKDAEIVEKVKAFVANGGGFIGLGEPTSVLYQGKYFQLSDVLGVDKDMSLSILLHKYNCRENPTHFILDDVDGEIDYAHAIDGVYAQEGTVILKASYDKEFVAEFNSGNVKMAVNEFGNGRSFYMAGMAYNHMNARILYRAILWCARKENELKKSFSSNYHVESHYYPSSDMYALVNNTNEMQATIFYDMFGNKKEIHLSPNEILWVKERNKAKGA